MVPFSAADLALAWLLDAAFGDPRWIPWPHPVAGVGRAAQRLEGLLRSPRDGPAVTVAKGFLFWALLVSGTVLAGWGLLTFAAWFHPWAGRALSIYLAYACLATRNLDAEARAVARLTESGDLRSARESVGMIVGRDTEGLPPREISRAALETVAENSSDGVVAPLLYLALGGSLGWGPLLGLAYKAVNTLDSTVGYRNERYEYFGKFSARMDDIANWVPARLTALLAAWAAQLLWKSGARALAAAVRDGSLHRSPNSGYPEAAFAGALGIQLGGTNTYGGIPRVSPTIGDPGPELGPDHVRSALKLLWGVSFSAALFGAGLLVITG